MYKEISKCRICGNTRLTDILNLGVMSLTGVFPRTESESVTSGPMDLVKCDESNTPGACGLLQLKQSYDLKEMYGANYGYRSGLNDSMVRHLRSKVARVLDFVKLHPGDLVIDIGSNDSTLLQSYTQTDLLLVGIDPVGRKFHHFYPPHIELIPEFFSQDAVKAHFGGRKAKVITSVAMFYDLENPLDFVSHIEGVLANDGIWLFEQSYMPSMLKTTAYDTICQEHLEYYGLRQIKWLTDRAGLKIIDLELNEANGGSIAVIAAKRDSSYPECSHALGILLEQEESEQLAQLAPYQHFEWRIRNRRQELKDFLKSVATKQERILGYGASTKGNVILQYCNLSRKELPAIAEVNEDKFGCFTPGTHIPIISEMEARAQNPDYFLVFPWHFREGLILRESKFLDRGGKLVFPLPSLEVISSEQRDHRRM